MISLRRTLLQRVRKVTKSFLLLAGWYAKVIQRSQIHVFNQWFSISFSGGPKVNNKNFPLRKDFRTLITSRPSSPQKLIFVCAFALKRYSAFILFKCKPLLRSNKGFVILRIFQLEHIFKKIFNHNFCNSCPEAGEMTSGRMLFRKLLIRIVETAV